MKALLDSLPQMRLFAEALAGHLRAGDLLILSGNLGAGKTTFTQSLGKCLGVQGRITSPTFIIAREHPSAGDGPTLVHVDAYRLSDAAELEDLDLDSELEESITVVEWGAGLAETLSSDYLSISITPRSQTEPSLAEAAPESADDAEAAPASADIAEFAYDDEPAADEGRIVELSSHGRSWTERLPRMVDSIRAAGLHCDEGNA
ncbi:tRNA (adenosine(37)-N6)-threonylcarbamoyltransferase complex ATPase subunit type 1 TsaE [Brevibacterium sp.]|uniref:tRNA (adenosine(37)-N6)-threonylcarbamoyltransferase complex ATPase subunit type 1 TsaE n=1 Tax=Brevibacterium sp. TaxID=1701 RepID=UPI002811F51E|nr:tRNA (adenosine(37)-N6)-threonylcarbamoyltransferase complex ATPase subunit type 1 TsaE [Brevibacterium sp.]